MIIPLLLVSLVYNNYAADKKPCLKRKYSHGFAFDPLEQTHAYKRFLSGTNEHSDHLVYRAVIEKKSECLRELLSHKAPVNVKVEGGYPLGWAALMGNTDAMRQLIAAGASIEAVDCFGNTPVQLACEAGSLQAFNLLRQHNAFLNRNNFRHMTSLHCAAMGGNIEIISQLLKICNRNAQDASGKTPLMVALAYKKRDAAIQLIESGASLHITDNDGNGILHYAATLADPEVNKMLLDYGAGACAHPCAYCDYIPLPLVEMCKLAISELQQLQAEEQIS